VASSLTMLTETYHAASDRSRDLLVPLAPLRLSGGHNQLLSYKELVLVRERVLLQD
jgi:hypothetical protein